MLAAYFRFILRHRIVVALVCAIVTGCAILAISRARMASSLGELILGDSPAYREYVQWTELFGSDERLVVILPTEALEGEEGVRRLRVAVEAVGDLDAVARVDSVLSFMEARQSLQLLVPFSDAPVEQGVQVDVRSMAADPVAGGMLVSSDGRWTALTVTIATEGEAMTLERAPQAVAAVVDVLTANGFDRSDIRLGGLVRALAEVQDQTRINLQRITPLVGVLMLLSTFLLFRRLWPVVITFLVGIVAIIWTIGFSLLLDPQINMLVALSPALILLISFADVVHLYAAWEQACRDGTRTSREALERSVTDVGRACLATSATTFVGFVGIAMINVPALRHLGLVLGFGVSIALLLAMTLTPIILSMISPPTFVADRGPTWLDRQVTRLRRLAVGYPWPIIVATVVIIATSIMGIMRITVETDITVRFPESSEFRQDLAFIGDHFGGTHTVEIYVRPDPAITSAELTRQVAAFHEAIAGMDGVARVMSPASLVSMVGDEAAGALMGTLWTSPGAAIASEFVAPDDAIRFVAVMHEHGMVNALQIGTSVQDTGEQLFGPSATISPSGLPYLAGDWLRSHMRAQRVAVLVSLSVVAMMMIIVLRSVRLGLWSMLPNLLPLIVLGGLLGFGWGVVDSDAVILVLVAMGIAVDDTIHFLTRARIESRRQADRDAALQATFDFAGRAIVMTSLIFAAGFLPFVIADYTTIRMLGLLLPVVMMVALLADLLLLPALLTVGIIRLPQRDRAT